MQLIRQKYTYPYMPVSKRKKYVPERNVCSIAPAQDVADYMYTGNGSHWVDVAGRPYDEEIIVKQELLYEPLWAQTPLPPDLRPYIDDIRKALLEGKPDVADQLIDQAQRDAGYDKYMNLDAKIVYPRESLRLHKAFSLKINQPEIENTENYLRWTDLLTGMVTTHWENKAGVFEREILPAYGEDLVAIRFVAPKESLNLKLDVELPGGPNIYGVPTMVGATHTLECSERMIKLSFRYNPDFGNKGYVGLLRFDLTGGTITPTENGVLVEGADSLLIYAKAIRIEKDFKFGCEEPLAEAFLHIDKTFEELTENNAKVLGGKMKRSRLRLGCEEDQYLSGEELLEKCHDVNELYPMMMDKLYDMGRFYQIADTGLIPPMWGQHNINTNLQVCAGNNTGLFEEMDVYFRYYESKFDDFRINAERLFGARGLLASVHCDYDSGLFYHFSRTYPHYCWTGCLGWIYNEFWGYYLCTGDEEFLAKRVVPALKEIALFFEDYAKLRDERGKTVFVPSFSPEDPTPNPDYMTVTCKDIHAQRINSVMDIAICREVLTNLLEACRILNIEQENMDKWQRQLDDLPVYLTDEEGALKEWAWETVEENYNHRHVSHHYDIWPGRAVTLESEPEIAEAIRKSNRKRGQQDDSAHGIIHRAFCAIRLKDHEEVLQNMSQLINHGFVRRNMSTAHFPYRGQFPDLQGAMPALLLEMCVFSMHGIVELLPEISNIFEKGSIEGIWLYTQAKLEKLAWTKESAKAIVTSGKEQDISFRVGKENVSFYINGKEQKSENGRMTYSFKKNETIELEIARK